MGFKQAVFELYALKLIRYFENPQETEKPA